MVPTVQTNIWGAFILDPNQICIRSLYIISCGQQATKLCFDFETTLRPPDPYWLVGLAFAFDLRVTF